MPSPEAMALSQRRVATIFAISTLIGALAGAGLVSAAERPSSPPIRLTDGNLTLTLHDPMVDRGAVAVPRATLELSAVAEPTVVRCDCSHSGKLRIRESRRGGLDHRARCQPATGQLNVLLDPDAARDYHFDLTAEDSTPFAITGCTLIDL